jgi:hypothetical protein
MNVFCIFRFQIVVFELFTAGSQIVFTDKPILGPITAEWYVSVIENGTCIKACLRNIISSKWTYIWHKFSGFHSGCCSNDFLFGILHHVLKLCADILEEFTDSMSEWLNVVEVSAEVIGKHSHHEDGGNIFFKIYGTDIYYTT